jgi:hypothetical protein
MAASSRAPATIAERVAHGWTGNRHRDLLAFALAELPEADAEWDREAARRYERGQLAKRLGYRRT